MVQGIHKDNDPQGRVQKMQDWLLSNIQSKWNWNCNIHSMRRLHNENRRQNIIDEYNWMHQERIYNLINGWIRGCGIKRDLTKMTLNIYQPYLMTKRTKGFNEDTKTLMTFSTLYTPHKGILHNQETDTTISYDLQKRYRSGIGSLI